MMYSDFDPKKTLLDSLNLENKSFSQAQQKSLISLTGDKKELCVLRIWRFITSRKSVSESQFRNLKKDSIVNLIWNHKIERT